jgi:hypothetical protein
VTPTPLDSYKLLRGTFVKDIKSAANRGLLGDSFRASLDFLSVLPREPLISAVTGKNYFAFSDGKRFSRAVNADLFGDDIAEWYAFEAAIKTKKSLKAFGPDRLTRLIYSVAISFCCYVDLTRSGDQKTPGTFFEYLIAHLFAWRLNVNPDRSIQVLNLDMKTSLTTDFIFNLGPERPKFHLPVKTSTRERVIQVWAHQRVLDGVFGTGRFLGTPVILTETKTEKTRKIVTEICLPDQWRIYQFHIAQLERIYYLDMPVSYEKLNRVFPPLHVKPFGEFFFEADALSV